MREEYPIPERYLFSPKFFGGFDTVAVLDAIYDCLHHYEERVQDFNFFRQQLLLGNEEFRLQIMKIFGSALVWTDSRTINAGQLPSCVPGTC